jgi:glycosyltransferase involved in cell wall biosynthesis
VKDFEVIVIDDGSTDGSLDLIREYKRVLNLRIYAEARSGNWVRGLNLGIGRSGGEFVTVLCQDDTWHEERARVLSAVISQHSDTSVIIHPSEFIDARSRRVGTWSCPFGGRDIRKIPSEDLLRSLIIQNFVSLPGVAFRRQLAVDLGPLDTELWFTADWQLWLELALRTSWLYVPASLTCFRLHGRSQTALGAKKAEVLRDQYIRVQEAYLPRLPFEDSEIHRLAGLGRLCTELNYSLAMASTGSWGSLARNVGRLLKLPLSDVGDLLRASRLVPRATSRMRARQWK